jgi:hypothetical protein
LLTFITFTITSVPFRDHVRVTNCGVVVGSWVMASMYVRFTTITQIMFDLSWCTTYWHLRYEKNLLLLKWLLGPWLIITLVELDWYKWKQKLRCSSSGLLSRKVVVTAMN